MNKEKFLEELKAMLNTAAEIEMETDLIDIENWDSFSMVAFIAMVKEKYNVEVEPFTVAEAILVEDLYESVNDIIGK